MRLFKAASVALAATISVGGLLAAAPAYAFTPVSELQDVNRNHWAYNAVQALVEKYRVMEGFPDKTFRGNRPVTRYEFAAALAKVMARVEEMQSGQAPSPSARGPEVTSEDLKTIAALQVEFRRELAELKGRVDNLEERVADLERVRITGKVTAMYRDRLAVDPAVAGLDANQANSPFQDAFNANDAMPVRVMSHLGINGAITPWATYHGDLHIDEMGFGQAAGRSTVAAGHRGYEGLLGSPVFIESSFVALGSWPMAHGGAAMGGHDSDEGNLLLAAGLMNFRNVINPGTKLKNHFGNVAYVGRGYGMLGFGGNQATVGGIGLPRYWGAGFDVSAVDPDSASYNNVSAPAVAVGAGWGPLKLAVGSNAGSLYTNRQAALQDLGLNGAAPLVGSAVGNSVRSDAVIGSATAGQNYTSDLLNLPSQYNDGYTVASLDLDFGAVRVNGSLGQFNNDGLFGFGQNRTNASIALDIGSDALGFAIQGNKSFLGVDRASLGLFSNDIAGSGFGFGIGANMAGRDLLVGQFGNMMASNAALYVVVPTFDGFLPQIVVGARQDMSGLLGATGAPQFGNSGLTASATYDNLGGSGFGVRAEYNSLMMSELWSFKPAVHDLGLFTTYKF